MFAAFTVVVLAFFAGAATASPLAHASSVPLGALTNEAASLPVVDIGSIAAKANTTLAATHEGIHTDLALGIYPATLLLCPLESCISCFPIDLSILPPNTCLAEQMSNIASVAIIQPSNAGLPYGVFVGGGDCSEFIQIPAMNSCFGMNLGRPLTDIAIN
ncbi:hypothetical protein FKP32DRAFT_1592119 [Trametes sanguinea]|nr:hypothetical protein FKP32DRAFT_1592119 [Trametes sanguinea]